MRELWSHKPLWDRATTPFRLTWTNIRRHNNCRTILQNLTKVQSIFPIKKALFKKLLESRCKHIKILRSSHRVKKFKKSTNFMTTWDFAPKIFIPDIYSTLIEPILMIYINLMTVKIDALDTMFASKSFWELVASTMRARSTNDSTLKRLKEE